MIGPLLNAGDRVAIAGAGCAGCSLACEILARCPGVHITLFDPEPSPQLNRTWCLWDTTPHRFRDAITTRWTEVVVRTPSDDIVFDASAYPYTCIHADDFYRVVDRATASSACEINRGASVVSMLDNDDGVDLEITDAAGSTRHERFAAVFDGRPPDHAGTNSEPVLLQHFGGLEFEVTPGSIDPARATLMDFVVPQQDGMHFMYILPFSTTRVLVESTFMSPSVARNIDYEANVLAYADRTLGIDTSRIVYRESGVLPMTMAPLGPKSTRRVWTIGTRAGVARASSGYAFDSIQRDTTRLVTAALAGQERPPPPRPKLLGTLDRVLISWLRDDPTAAPLVFGNLFRTAPADRLIRFLSDTPRLLDYLAVMWAMPKTGVIRHALASPSAWPKRLPR
ncbi:MAG: lycopene cyclase family protein [Planctomycetota bacterium]